MIAVTSSINGITTSRRLKLDFDDFEWLNASASCTKTLKQLGLSKDEWPDARGHQHGWLARLSVRQQFRHSNPITRKETT